jgi:hypothetical protein
MHACTITGTLVLFLLSADLISGIFDGYRLPGYTFDTFNGPPSTNQIKGNFFNNFHNGNGN